MYTVVWSACTSAQKMISDPKTMWDYIEIFVSCHVGTKLRTSAGSQFYLTTEPLFLDLMAGY